MTLNPGGNTAAPGCFVIGNGVLAARCLAVLRETGRPIVGLHSSDGSLRGLAKEMDLHHADTREGVYSTIGDGVHLIFSINNPWILPPALISRAQRAAVNFHDALLPRYAGLHATSWALMNQENEHGITWHQMSAGIDEGHVFVQRRFPVRDDDTALSLNARCHDEGVDAFRELLGLLDADTPPKPQPSGARSYYGAVDRPVAACVLSLEDSAAAICATVRALDFGPALNPLGLPKLAMGGRFVTIGTARRVTEGRNLVRSVPGTVCRVVADGIVVATGTDDVLLGGMRTLEGRALDSAMLAAEFGVVSGMVIPDLSREDIDSISQMDRRIARNERSWAQRLLRAVPWAYPLRAQGPAGSDVQRLDLSAFSVAAEKFPTDERATFLLASAAAHFVRLLIGAGKRADDDIVTIDLGFSGPAQQSSFPQLFEAVVPLRIEVPTAGTFARLRSGLDAERAFVDRAHTYARDLIRRHPALRGPGGKGLPNFPVVLLHLPHRPQTHPALVDGAMAVAVYDDGSPPELFHTNLAGWQVDSIAASLACCAFACAQDGQIPLRQIPMLGQQERQRILVQWNDTEKSFPRDRTVYELFQLQAARTPTAPAVCFDGISLCYADLDRRSNQMARRLGAAGIGRGDLVGLCLKRGPDLIVGLLGILKTGAAYVPLDPSYPADRLSFMIADSGLVAAVTDRTTGARLLAALPEARRFSFDDAGFDATGAEPLAAMATPEDLAYVIYTSGSTGRPKGVEIRHISLVNHGTSMAALYGLGAGDRMLCSASISFDVAGEQIYPALFSGAEVVIRPEDLMESFDRFDDFARRENISAMVLPTAFWHEWVRALQGQGRKAPPSLRVVGVGTEKVQGERLAAWQRLTEDRVRFLQGYGPTEATITATAYVHQGGAVDPERPAPIGRPLPNTEVYLLDEQGSPVPIGIPGQIHIGGVGLARGYRGRDDLTRAAFIDHPFREGARLYKTGDLAYFEPDGQLVFLGRSDGQIKLRGHRIELGEIEAALRDVPGVGESVVLLREDKPGCLRLVGYFVPTEAGAPLDLQAVRKSLGDRLPEVMVPSALVSLAAFPVTINGKVDRQSLLPPLENQDPQREAARDDLEILLAGIFCEQLGISVVGVHDNFFEIGGHSLLGVRLLSLINAACQANLTLQDLFAAPTVAGLASRARGGQGRTAAIPTLIPLTPPSALTTQMPPVFFIAGVHLYQPLARVLGGQGRTFGVYLPEEGELFRSGTTAGLPSVEKLAARYLEAIRSSYPHGPYALVGFSFGGAIAFEIARQLRVVGETVAFLAIIDLVLPRGVKRDPLRWVGARLSTLRQRGLRQTLVRLGKRVLRHWAPASPQATLPDDLAFLDGLRTGAYAESLRRYDQTDHPYDGPLVLLRSDRRQGLEHCVIDTDLGWGPLVRGGVEVQVFPGDHLDLMRDPAVDAVAQALKDSFHSRCT